MSIITRINKAEKRIVDLYNKLKNLPSGETPTPVDSRPYKVYTALLNQSGTNAPVATVLENSVPINVTYSYIGVGIFRCSFPYPSDISYTELAIILGKIVGEQMGALYTYDSLGYSGGNIVFSLKTKSNASTFSNNLLNLAFIEIRVYN